jgi:hypothetical protein
MRAAPTKVGLGLFGTYGWVVILAPDTAKIEFYSVAAQIIPVGLLVLAVEARLLRVAPAPAKSGSGRREFPTMQVFVMLALFGGEYSALHPLATGRPEDGGAGLVWGSLAVGAVAIALLALFGPARDEPAKSDADSSS